MVVVVVIVCSLAYKLYVQSVVITTKVVSSNPADVEVYSMQPYAIKVFSEFRQAVVLSESSGVFRHDIFKYC